MRDSVRRVGEIVASIAVAIVLWWGIIAVFHVSSLVIPAPQAVLVAGFANFGFLIASTFVTLGEALAGFLAAIIIAVLLAVGLVTSPFASRVLLPALVAINTAPKVVVAPVLVIWFGLGVGSKIGMAFLLCFFPIVINAAQGMREVDPELIDLYRLMQAGAWTTLYRVRIPNSIPYLLSGLKIAWPLAIIGAVIGEFVAAKAGIGYQIMLAYSNSNTELVFAAVILITIVSVLAFQLLAWTESFALRHYPVTVESRASA